MRRIVSAVLLFVATPAAGADLEWSLRLLNRLSVQKDAIETQILFDPEARRFRVADYLSPALDQLFSTHTLGLTLDANVGRGFGLTFNLDSGALRVGPQNETATLVVPVGRRLVPLLFPTTATSTAFTANGSPFTDEARRSFFVREAFATWWSSDRATQLYAGKRRMVLAEGFLYDQFTFAAGLRLEGGAREGGGSWRFDLDAMVADGSFDTGGKASPLVHLSLSYVPGPLQHLGFTLIYFHDGDDLFSEVFRTSILEASVARANAGMRASLLAVQVPFGSRGDLVWFGLTGRRFAGDHIVSGLLLGQAGRVRASALVPSESGGPPVVAELDAAAYGVLVDLHYRYDLTEDLAVGGFFTLATGDASLADGFRRQSDVKSVDAFLSLFPFVNRANLFFNGGLNAELTQRRASTLGVNARGVIAAGAFARYDSKATSLEARVVGLAAPTPSLYDGKIYGLEIDLVGTRRLARYLRVVAEADFFLTGSFFGAQRTVVQLILGLDVVLP